MTAVVHHMVTETASCPQQPVSLGVHSEAGTLQERNWSSETHRPAAVEPGFQYRKKLPTPTSTCLLISTYEDNCEEDQPVLSQATCSPGFRLAPATLVLHQAAVKLGGLCLC